MKYELVVTNIKLYIKSFEHFIDDFFMALKGFTKFIYLV